MLKLTRKTIQSPLKSDGSIRDISRYTHSSFLLAGIEFSSPPCVDCDVTENAIYTNITEFIDWIEAIADKRPEKQG